MIVTGSVPGCAKGSMMSKRTSVLVAAVVGVLAGAIVGGSALVGAAARSGSDGSGSTSTATPADDRPCGALLDKLPDDLKADLLAVRDLPVGAERRAALKEIAEKARDGKYGETVERFADRRLDHRKELWDRLPADLRADLRELRETPVEERRAAFEELRESALAGDYGPKVQQFAERRQERRELCRE